MPSFPSFRLPVFDHNPTTAELACGLHVHHQLHSHQLHHDNADRKLIVAMYRSASCELDKNMQADSTSYFWSLKSSIVASTDQTGVNCRPYTS
ncbi:conserved hypothetical protein [Coccidioides posadasii str. Silveira]|uniref:Uncharacterized protein n=2 Tax=Coccidioides posadasii TaxID=199306 RepID=E9CYD9_COCPS|nr:conserved hypothetical protein [Coccidioides posadasii str. Silveira]KMM72480.1 hypothetical protein CPAG_08775 [Coccidioides posadasii RMSCC 3488]